MVGFISQVLASAVLLWNLKRHNQFPFSQAISLFTEGPATPVVPIEDIYGFPQFFQPNDRVLR